MKRLNKSVLIHVLVWLAIILISAGDELWDDDESPVLDFLRIGIGIVIFYINYIVLVPKLFFKKQILLYIISVIVLVLSGTFLLDVIEAKDYFKPFLVERNSEGSVGFLVYAVIVVIGSIIRTYREWNINQVAKQKIESQKKIAELEALKNQINPHFLFNSLNSICSLAVKKSDETPDAIIRLSELMRYMLYDAKETIVLLQKEIDYLKNYIELQKLRLVNKDTVTLDISGTISSQKIPPLLLISFIENAFKYGVDVSGKSNIDISIKVEGDTMNFNCSNNIIKRPKKEDGFGIGVKNTKDRLQLLFPNKHQLRISENDTIYKVNLTLTLN